MDGRSPPLNKQPRQLLSILFTVAPVFVLIGIGYGAVRLGYLSETSMDGLNAFAVRLGIPVLLFGAMARLDLSLAFSPAILISFYAGSVACFAIGIVLARTVFGRRPGESVAAGFAGTYVNVVLIGVPIIERAYGPQGVAIAFGVVALQAPFIFTAGMLLMELMRRDGRPVGETLTRAARAVITNPFMIGIMCGLAVNMTGWTLPYPIAASIDMIAAAAIPAALVAIGGTLIRYRLTAAVPETAVVAGLSLVVHPLIALILAHYVFGLPPIAVHATVALAALPPGVNVYVFAAMYDRAVGLTASALLMATALAVMTVTLWLYALSVLVPL